MTRLSLSFAAALAAAVALSPGLTMARVGGGGSFGSRGGMTYSAPPSTGTSSFAAPMQRSFTPRAAEPAFGGAAAPAFGGGGFGRGGAFSSGLMGGLLGAGIGGLLFGHGMFGGMSGGSSFIGLLIQFALIFFIGRFIFKLVMGRRQPMFAGGSGGFGGSGAGSAPMGMAPAPARSGPPPIAIVPADYQQFEQLLKSMQAAWSAEDLNGLRAIATPEMVSYFSEQMSELRSRGLRNQVADVRLDKGDLSQAWTEGSREYATVAMRFSMMDVTTDGQGRVVDGSATERQLVTEVWTFLRSPGGRWVLSAIQQGR